MFMFMLIAYLSGCDVINFEINLIFLIKPVLFLLDQKAKTKM